jgi:hypothetical protein
MASLHGGTEDFQDLALVVFDRPGGELAFPGDLKIAHAGFQQRKGQATTGGRATVCSGKPVMPRTAVRGAVLMNPLLLDARLVRSQNA